MYLKTEEHDHQERLDLFLPADPLQDPQEVRAQRLQALPAELKDNVKSPYYEKKYTFGNVIPVQFNLYRSIT